MDLSPFLNKNLFEAGQNLFDQLGIKLNSNTSTSIEPKNVLKDLYKDRAPYNLISESYFLGLIDDNLFNDTLFASSEDKISFKEATQKIDNKYKGIIVYAVSLKNHYPTRTQLSELTRAFNRASKNIPVILLTLYKNDEEQLLSFSTTERTEYEQTWREGEKTGKVSLLRDIKLLHTHTGHKKILLDLKINSSVKSFDALYKQWQEVFNVQLLNKKFFQELACWYFWAVTKVSFPDDVLKDKNIRNATNVIRLLTRLIFVWFIKEKGLVSEDLFDEEKLKNILKFNDSNKSSYYKAILQNLFFATLNTEKGKRRFRGQNDNGRDAHYFIHNVFRYKSEFVKPQETLEKLFDPIPFLNGGLFECLDKEVEIKNKLVPVRIDGFSDRSDNPVKVPDQLFFSPEKEVDLNKVYDTKNKKYKVRGLINLLSSYKFTIAENTPLEEDIALDPELLGKVFENLLANYNGTQTTARKQTGSFYTPREIVNYMVDESLIAHLKTKILSETFSYQEIGEEQLDLLGNTSRKGQLKIEADVEKNRWIEKEDELEKELRSLISYSESELSFNPDEKKALVKAIDNMKVLDPACGSGAFPMGVLHKLVLMLHKLDPKNTSWKKRQIERAETIEDPSAREEAVNKIENAFDKNELDYGRKLYLIENCIYGIDIQPIAAQISKLRFFISLIVDQKVNWNSPATNYDIEPLPNLETKFVAANTLIGIERPDELRFNKAVELKENELRKNRERYFTARSSKTKERYRSKDRELREEIVKLIKKDFEEFSNTKQNQIKEKQKLVTLYSKELDKTYEKLKDKKLTDGQNKILEQQAEKQLKAIKTEEKKLAEFESQLLDSSVIDETASTLASWDPYDQNASSSFFDLEWMFGLINGFDIVIGNPPYVQLQKDGGKLAEQFKNQKYLTFERTGDIYSLFYERGHTFLRNNGFLTFITSNKWMRAGYGKSLREFFSGTNTILLVDFGQTMIFENAIVHSNILIIQKAPNVHMTIMVQFKDEYYQPGISIEAYVAEHRVVAEKLTGEIWAIAEIKDVVIKEKFEEIGKPLKKWDISYNYGIKTGYNEAFIIDGKIKADLVAKDARAKDILNPILRGRDTRRYYCNFANLWMISTFPSLKIDIEKYPIIKNYLLSFGKKRLEQTGRQGSRKKTSNKWFEVQDTIAYWEEFKKPKIIFSEIVSEPQFYYDTERYYPEATVFFITGERLKYLTALLNSKAVTYVFKKFYAGGELVGKYRYKKAFLENLPIPVPDNKTDSIFVNLVDRILDAKKANPNNDTTKLEKQIDELVYKIYNLDEEEISIIEGKS